MISNDYNNIALPFLPVSSFPLGDPARLNQWVLNTRRFLWVPNSNSRLCSRHFEKHHFSTDSQVR